MSGNFFKLIPRSDLSYYGKSDLLAQISDELRNNPDSCFAQNVIAWYNAEYSALGEVEACEYQVAINEKLCPDDDDNPVPETLTDVIDIIGGFVEGKPRRVGRAAIRIICREATRNNKLRTAPGID